MHNCSHQCCQQKADTLICAGDGCRCYMSLRQDSLPAYTVYLHLQVSEEPRSLGHFSAVGVRGKSGGLCDLFITLLDFSVPGSPRLCTVTCVGAHTSPLPHYAASHCRCLRNKQWVASAPIINVLGERKVLTGMWGTKMSSISNSIINLNQMYTALSLLLVSLLLLLLFFIILLHLLSLLCQLYLFHAVISQTGLCPAG